MFKLVFLLVLCISVGFCAEIKLNGPKDCPTQHVTVYRDRSEVSRHVKINPSEPGDLSLVIEGLSTLIDKNSVTVAFGLGNATLLEVGCYESYTQPTDDGSKAKLQKDLEEVTDNIFVVNSKQDRIKKELDLLEIWTKEQAPKDTADFLEIYNTKSQELEIESHKMKKEVEQLRKRKTELENAIQKLVVPLDAKSNVKILLRVNNPGEIKLLLSYVISNTSWTPKYDIRVSSEKISATITYYGAIINLSQENWTDVSLALSTSTTNSNIPPTLQTMRIGDIYSTWNEWPVREGVSSVFGIPAPKMETTNLPWMLTLDFNIPKKADILSDGIPHKVIIAELDLSCDLLYEVMPKVSSHAYLKANVTNNSSYPLLPGSANVFLDNNFVNETNLQYVPKNEKLEVFLGIDDAIVVDRKEDKVFSVEKSGSRLAPTKRTYCHESTIKNTKKVKVPMKVYEQVPLSSNYQIKVTLQEPILAGLRKDPGVEMDSKNILVWSTVLSPGEAQTFVATYQVESTNSYQY